MIFIIVLTICIVCMIHNSSSINRGSAFENIRQSVDFIDKTLLIKELTDLNEPLVIAAPDGFGKSSNLDMLRMFLSSDFPNSQKQRLFENTKIFMDSDFVKKHFGNYTLIYCTFKQDKSVLDYPSMISTFRSVLYRTFISHTYLLKSRRLSKTEKRKITFYTGSRKFLSMKLSQIVTGLHFLAKLLKKHHKKEVIILIDDYDTIILDSLFTNELDYESVLAFHNAIFSATIHQNQFTNRIILAGTTCTCIKPLAQLNVRCVGLLEDEKMTPFFGITEQEIDHLLDRSNFRRMRHRKKEIRKWYGGYTSVDLKTHVYNTKSTLNFMNVGELKSYWCNTRALRTLKYLLIEPAVQNMFNSSMQRRPVELRTPTGPVDLAHLRALRGFTDYELWEEDNAPLFISLLTEMGFFTHSALEDTNKSNNRAVKLPNEEIVKVFQQIYDSFFQDSQELLDRLKKSLHEVCFEVKTQEEEQNSDALFGNVRDFDDKHNIADKPD